MFDIEQYGKRPVDRETTPYAERQKLLREVLPHLPSETFHLPPEATTSEDAAKLWADIREGRHPLTREGIVIHPPTGKPKKAKLYDESDVHITGTFPGEGKYKGIGAGGFEYSLEPGGDVTGRVGSGLSDELRRDLYADPDAYVGRRARIRHQGPFGSGAFRAPSLIALHEDYPTKEASWEEWPKEADDEEHVPTVAVDLDGTLAENLPTFDPEKIGKPRKNARKWLQRFRRAGARIVIFTVRGDEDLVREWLARHRMPYDYVNENTDQPADSSGKIVAEVYWDDRAVDASVPLDESGPEVLSRLKAANDRFPLAYSAPEDILQIIYFFKDA